MELDYCLWADRPDPAARAVTLDLTMKYLILILIVGTTILLREELVRKYPPVVVAENPLTAFVPYK